MAYDPKLDWEDLPSTDTPILAADLVRIETGVKAAWVRWAGTQSEYDAIVTKDPDTLYVITDV